MAELTYTTAYSLIRCGSDGCEMQFAVPDSWLADRKRDHRGWYCPNGHCRAFMGESDIERAQRQALRATERADREERWRRDAEARTESTERRARALRGVITKTKRRIAHGVCPCCKRSFSALHRHMKNQHPDYVAAATGAGE